MIKLGLLSLLLIPLWAMALPPNTILFKTNVVMSSNNKQPWPASQNQEFMTSADIASGTLSNLRIKNTGGSSRTITGIYIFTLTSNPSDCTTSTLYDSQTDPYGALWAPKVTITQNQTISIGANYLYNMMMLSLYEAYIAGYTGGHYTPGNAEEGNHEWCLWLGITDELTTPGDPLPLGSQLVQYIDPDNTPINFTNVTCNDSTRTCSTADTIQPQPFPHQG